MQNRAVPGCPIECSIPKGRASSNNYKRMKKKVFYSEFHALKRSSENSTEKNLDTGKEWCMVPVAMEMAFMTIESPMPNSRPSCAGPS